MTKEELLEKIKNNPDTAKHYLLLAFLLESPEETVELLKLDPLDPEPPVVMTQQELFLKTIELDGTQALAYLALTNQLEGEETITLNDGRSLGKKELILEAIHRSPGEPLPYSTLAFETEDEETAALLDGRTMNRNQLLLEAVHLDRHFVLLRFRAKYFVTPPDTVTLPDGRQLTQQELVTAIIPRPMENNPLENEPLDSLAAAGLVLTMEPGEKIFIPGQLPGETIEDPPPGEEKSREDIALEAIQAAAGLDGPEYAFPFRVHALILNPGETVDTGSAGPGETGYIGLVAKAIEKSPDDAVSYLFAGLWLKPGETLTLTNGEQMTQVTLLKRVLELDPGNALGHLGLGYSIGTADTLTVGGTAMTRRQLFLRAAELDPNLPAAYLCLALSLDPADRTASVVVNGEEKTAGDLFETYNTLSEGEGE